MLEYPQTSRHQHDQAPIQEVELKTPPGQSPTPEKQLDTTKLHTTNYMCVCTTIQQMCS